MRSEKARAFILENNIRAGYYKERTQVEGEILHRYENCLSAAVDQPPPTHY